MNVVVVVVVVVVSALACVVVGDVDLREKTVRDEYCGDNVKWALNDGVLRISGSGKMYDYLSVKPPWYSESKKITRIIIENGVTYIGMKAFYLFTELVNVTFPHNEITIGSNAFESCFSLTSMALPDSVVSVEANAFFFCNELVTVNISKNLRSIGDGAFSSCDRLTSVNADDANAVYKSIDGVLFTRGNNSTLVCFPRGLRVSMYNIPDGVVSIGSKAFDNPHLQRVNIPASVESVGIAPFRECTGLAYIDVAGSNAMYKSENWVLLTKDDEKLVQAPSKLMVNSYSVPNGVKTIEDYAFYKTSLESVVIPGSVTSIGEYAFAASQALLSIEIPDTVVFIGNASFSGCTELNSVFIGDGVDSIGKGSFCECSKLSTLNIGRGVKSIGKEAFLECKSLTSVEIPDGVISIEESAFEGCSAMTDLTLGDGVESIGKNAFNNCGMFSIDFGSKLKSIEERAFWGCQNLKSVVIPDSVESIGEFGFYCCIGIESVKIGKGLKTLDSHAFESCFSLVSFEVDKENPYFSSIDGVLFDHNISSLLRYPQGNTSECYIVPDGVKSIGEAAFSNCQTLKNITLPDGLKSIGFYAFISCRFEGMRIPDTVTLIGDLAFTDCTDLRNIVIPNGVKSIGFSCFSNCRELVNVTLPDSLVSIGNGAFSGCYHLKSVIIPGNVLLIDDEVFSGCSSLISVVFDGNITSIGKSSFYNCRNLKNLTIPESVTSIGEKAFELCTSLKTVVIPNTVAFIGDRAFHSCKELTNLSIGDGVEVIGDESFHSCNGLTRVIIPSGVASIGNDAFGSCSSLSAVYYLGSNNISSNIFESSPVSVVCVPPDYESELFGGALVSSDSTDCLTFRKMFNHCYEGFFVDGVFDQRVRLNASEYEKQTRDCVERHCDNETGPVAWSFCNTSEEITRVCLSDKCIEEKNIPEKDKWSVVIEVDEVKSDKINISEIAVAASELTGIDVDDLSVGVEYDGNGFAIRIIIYVKAEDMATAIVKAIKTMDKGKGCAYGALCRSTTVVVRVPENGTHSLSHAWSIHVMALKEMVIMIVLVSMTM